MKLCRLITLDIMGTLLDIRIPVGVTYSEVAKRYGVDISPDLLTSNFKKAWDDMRVKHANYGLNSGIGWEKWWRILVNQTFTSSSSHTIENEALNSVSNQLINMYNRPDQWKFCDGAMEFLSHCQDKKIALAVVSNFDKRLEELLEGVGMRKYFRFVVASYTVGFEKPDQKIFNITETIARSFDDLQNIKKNEILHIGDTPELDYIPAKAAGWNAYLVNNDSDVVIQKHPAISKEFIFKDFHKIKEALQ